MPVLASINRGTMRICLLASLTLPSTRYRVFSTRPISGKVAFDLAAAAADVRDMGRQAALGRTFAPEEERAGGQDVVVISHELWQKTFGADTKIIGQTLRFDRSTSVVIGVMPPGFAYPTWADAWRPLAQLVGRDPVIDRRDFHADSRAIGRLAPGVDAPQAARLLSTVQARIAGEFPKEEGDWVGVDAAPLQTEIVGDVRTAILGLGGAVGLILLVACVNLANLAAVRGASRGREVAIRFALGASRVQVMADALLEITRMCASFQARAPVLTIDGSPRPHLHRSQDAP